MFAAGKIRGEGFVNAVFLLQLYSILPYTQKDNFQYESGKSKNVFSSFFVQPAC